ncbi:MAG TPA: hypothetical protein VFX12_12415 [Vicinamibacterales bacterium]|nr:hypothetical protein [Vicinamibacterales bacterium]
MADAGASHRSAPHIATGQWQTFELRMRRRRADGCLRRAEAALAAGRLDDARGAVAEARGLDPDSTQAALIDARLAAWTPPVAPARSASTGLPLVVILLLACSAGLGAWLVLTRPTSPVRIAPIRFAPLATSSGVPSLPGSDLPLAPLPERRAAPASDASSTPGPSVAPAAATIRNEPAPQSHADSTESERPSRVTTAPPVNVSTPDPRPPDEASTEPPAVTQPLPLATVAPPPAPAPAQPLPVSAVPAPPSAVPSTTETEAQVRRVLAAYASAYDRLDAAAARAVWPGVDAAALAHAFEGLASQHVALGTCQIDLHTAGARANCRGTATWSPRIGGGSQTQARRWTFELAGGNGAWHIVSARTESR